MKLLLLISLFISARSFGQTADFLILKKHDKTLTTYYSGTNIAFMTTSGAYIDALINEVKHDTLYLQEFVVQKLLTTFGTFIDDTVGSYHYKFHYNQIRSIGLVKRQNFDWRGSGAALLGGGALLTLASGVVYVADRKHFSAPLLIASAALGTLGYFMAKGGNNGIVIGKKYKLQYMNMSNDKN